MESNPTVERKAGKGRTRALVRRGVASSREPAVALATKRLHGTTMCERCGNVYRHKRWLRAPEALLQWPVGVRWTVCPACRQVERGEYYGNVQIRGAAAHREAEAVRRRIERVAARAQYTQPQRRIVSMEPRDDGMDVLTTSQKLAHRIVRALLAAFGGKGSYAWLDEGELAAIWRWDGDPMPYRTSGSRSTLGRRAPLALEVRSPRSKLDPAWRALIAQSAERWSELYPELLRVHATVRHGRHRHGAEEVALVATYPRRTLRVEKGGARMEEAIRAACSAMTRELRKAREELRGVG